MFVVGDKGTILHSTGDGSWQPQPSGSLEDLYAVWGSTDDDVYAVGERGTVLHLE